jgi:hypothetical protein
MSVSVAAWLFFSLLALAALDRGGCLLHRILCPPFRLSKFLRAHFARD